MQCGQLLKILDKGEDSANQFKKDFSSIDSLTAEITAFANSQGGNIFTGVDDNGNIIGLSKEDIKRLNNWISNACSQKMEPPVFVSTNIIACEKKRVMLISVPRGINKPYCANKKDYWVKNGADKRRATRDELFRLMQASSRLFADEMLTDISLDNLDYDIFTDFFVRHYHEEPEAVEIDRTKLLENLKLAGENRLTLAGLLVFGTNVENLKPQFSIKSTRIQADGVLADKQDIGGRLLEQFQQGIDFLSRNLHRIPLVDDFNAPGVLEIPMPVIKEVLANALVHRDYFVNAPVFINISAETVEIVSPGCLPNTVSVENIRLGIHIERNPIILSFMAKEPAFGYTGRGNGIPKVVKLCNELKLRVDFINDKTANRFKIVFYRKKSFG